MQPHRNCVFFSFRYIYFNTFVLKWQYSDWICLKGFSLFMQRRFECRKFSRPCRMMLYWFLLLVFLTTLMLIIVGLSCIFYIFSHFPKINHPQHPAILLSKQQSFFQKTFLQNDRLNFLEDIHFQLLAPLQMTIIIFLSSFASPTVSEAFRPPRNFSHILAISSYLKIAVVVGRCIAYKYGKDFKGCHPRTPFYPRGCRKAFNHITE